MATKKKDTKKKTVGNTTLYNPKEIALYQYNPNERINRICPVRRNITNELPFFPEIKHQFHSHLILKIVPIFERFCL